MRRAILALSSTIAGLVLLLSFKTHIPGSTDTGTTAASGSGGASSSGAAGAGSADMAGAGDAGHARHAGRKPGKARPRHGAAARTVTGTVADTTYGPMQVQLTLAGQSITSVKVLQRTDTGAESDQIDANAIPKLINETLAVQSAHINAVSGASYTSAGYRRSLQSALDQAGA
jgi:uncharacterized protein with FMN-binding domain